MSFSSSQKTASTRSASSPPLHLLLITADQLRLDHVGHVPGSRMRTPNIDRIAASAAFTGTITASPMCQPARAALLTGKYPHQVGLATMSGDLSPQHPTFPRALQTAGYHTAVFGKLHLLQGWDWFGKIPGNHNLVALKNEIQQFGFDHVWETSGKFLVRRDHCDWAAHLTAKGVWPDYLEHLNRCAGNRFVVEEGCLDQVCPWPLDDDDHVDLLTARKTIEHLQTVDSSRPFFVHCSFCGPHVPYDPPARYLEEFLQDPPDPVFDPGGCISGENLRALHKMQQAYKAMVRLIDDQVGRILDTLESRNLLDRTLIIFTSDHGEMLGDHGLLQKGYPQWQSLSIPLAIRLPGSTNRTLNHSPVELTDVTATLLDAAGLDPREALSKSWPSYHNLVPCRSLLPLVRGEVRSIRDWAYAESDARWHSKDPTEESHWQVLQNETWHYQRHVQVRDSTPENYLREKLFHRASDPEYQTDRSTDPSCQDLLQECRRLRDYIASTTPPAQIGWAPLE